MLIWVSLLCIFGILSCTSIIYKFSDKLLKAINYFQALLLMIIFSFNRFNNDYVAYQNYFSENPDFLEWGYRKLIIAIKMLNGNHNWIILTSGFFLINFYFLKNKNRYSSVIAFVYILNNFLYDITQIRNTLLLICLSYGIYYSMKKNKYYYIWCFLGTIFQSLGIIYLGYGLLQKIRIKNFFKIIILGNVFGFIFIELLMMILIKYFPEKANIYILERVSLIKILFCYILVGVDLLIFKFLKVSESKNQYYKKIYKFYLYLIIFMPLTMLTLEIFARMYRNIFLFKCILITSNFKNLGTKKKLIATICLIFSTVLPIVSYNFKFYINLINNLNYINFSF